MLCFFTIAASASNTCARNVYNKKKSSMKRNFFACFLKLGRFSHIGYDITLRIEAISVLEFRNGNCHVFRKYIFLLNGDSYACQNFTMSNGDSQRRRKHWGRRGRVPSKILEAGDVPLKIL